MLRVMPLTYFSAQVCVKDQHGPLVSVGTSALNFGING